MSNGIDFIIGGKDQAKPAMTSVESSLKRLEQKTEEVGKSTNRLAMLTGGLAAAYAGVKAAIAALGGIDKINAAYDVQTKAVKDLTLAMRVRGDSSGVESAQLQKFAADLQKLSGVGDEVTIGLMKQAATMGFARDRIDDAAKAAVGLSEVTGKDLNASLSDMKAALEGNFEAFIGLNPQIQFMRTNQEKMAAVMQIVDAGLKSTSENMTTVAGSSQRASGAFGDLMETVGALLAPVRVLLNAGIQKLSESLQTVLAPAAAYATEVLANIGPMIDWVREKVVQGVNLMIGAFTFFEVILTNLDSVWQLVVAQAELYMEQVIGVVMHALTEVIPAYAGWFAENFINLIRDGLVGAFTVVVNGIAKIVDAFSALWEFIASGGQTDVLAQLGEISGRSYLEGFESSLTALPEVAGRQLSEREKQLQEQVAEIGGRLGKEFSDKFSERMIGVGSSLAEEIDAANTGLDLKGRQQMFVMQSIQVTQGRLQTRGPGSSIPNKLDRVIELMQKQNSSNPWGILVNNSNKQTESLKGIMDNTSNTVQMEAIA
jgi:hypothetical protein